MSDDNDARKMFKNGMELFRDKNYTKAKDAFYSVGDMDKRLSSNCSTLSALYYNLSFAAALGDTKHLRNIQEITYENTNFDGLQTAFLRQFMTDFKNIMESVFDYKNREDLEGVVSWYNGVADENLKNSKDNLLL